MGKRGRRRSQGAELGIGPAPSSVYADPEAGQLELRGALSPASRRRYAETRASGLDRDDAEQRATELLFEHLAVAWTIAEVRSERPQELLGRYRMASRAERDFVRGALRDHLAEHFPELPAP